MQRCKMKQTGDDIGGMCDRGISLRTGDVM